MSETNTLSAEPKERAGKGAARAERRAGRVPAVIYGNRKAPVMVSLEAKTVQREMSHGTFFSTLYDLKVGKATDRVLARDVQLHPVTDVPLHVDFLRVSASTRINVNVPVVFLNEEECPGLKRGGLLNIVRHEVEVYCLADEIPQEFAIDLAALDLDIGATIHASAIDLPNGVELAIADRDFTVATIAAPTVEAEEGEAEEEAEAPEGEAPAAEADEAGEPGDSGESGEPEENA